MAAHDAEDCGEAETAPGKFCGEERVENPLHHLGRHPAALVRDIHVNVFAGGQIGREMRGGKIGAIGVHDAGAHADDPAPVAERLGGVEDEVHDDLPHLRAVGENLRQRGDEIELERDIFADGNPEQVGGFADDPVQIEIADEEAALARVGKHLFAKLGGTGRCDFDLVEAVLRGGTAAQLGRGHAGVAEDAGEEVVEIVRDAPGEHAETFELLRLLEFALDGGAVLDGGAGGVLGLHALGHILHEGEDGNDAPPGVAQHGIVPDAVNHGAGFGEVAIVADVAPVASVEQTRGNLAHALDILGMDECQVVEFFPDHVAGTPAEHSLRLPAPAVNDQFGLPFDDGERRVLHVIHHAQTRAFELLVRGLQLGDVAADARQSDDLSLHVAQRELRGEEPALRAVGADERLLAVDHRLTRLHNGHFVGGVAPGVFPNSWKIEIRFSNNIHSINAEKPHACGVQQHEAPLAVLQKNRIGDRVEHRAKPPALVGQTPLHLAAARDVVINDEPREQRAVRIAQCDDRHFAGDGAPVPPHKHSLAGAVLQERFRRALIRRRVEH